MMITSLPKMAALRLNSLTEEKGKLERQLNVLSKYENKYITTSSQLLRQPAGGKGRKPMTQADGQE